MTGKALELEQSESQKTILKQIEFHYNRIFTHNFHI